MSPIPNRRVSASGPEGSKFETDSAENPPCIWAYCILSYTQGDKSAPAGVVGKFGGKGVSTQVSSSSSDRCSKLRGSSSKNSPRVASKRDTNVARDSNLFMVPTSPMTHS
ncbi:hypothetical protein AVEN_210098-1 [Araneus ventricosus]|uniref:Uncharacterized protein n=1 Tax=Araneus ventricosus TaxID=182803 RepID=A0A4Y2GBE5_ARAVE|nr:hypothetical protein AVEN_210098-1 [Araneus ventricosus]